MSNQREVTDEDLQMIQYFWEKKEDVERYCDWREIQKSLKEKHPAIVKAWDDYKASRAVLAAVLKGEGCG